MVGMLGRADGASVGRGGVVVAAGRGSGVADKGVGGGRVAAEAGARARGVVAAVNRRRAVPVTELRDVSIVVCLCQNRTATSETGTRPRITDTHTNTEIRELSLYF